MNGNLYEEIRVVTKFLEAHPGKKVLVSFKWELEGLAVGGGYWGNITRSVRGTPEPEGEAAWIAQRLKEVLGSKWWMERT